jgi:hypothetical protein
MKNLKILFLLFLIIVFFIGLYLYTFNKLTKDVIVSKENMDNDDSCPDILINKGNSLLLFNSKKPVKDGENPIPFFSLDDYINYLEIQRKKGIKCPVLYLQQENDTQGNDVYRVRPGPFDLQGGIQTHNMTIAGMNHQDLPVGPQPTLLMKDTSNLNKNKPSKYIDASRENGNYNKGNYAGFDPYGLYIGSYTEIDKIHDSTSLKNISDNPMDTNWGGVTYTEQAVNSGKYDEYNIYKPNYVNPKGIQIPNLFPGILPPDDKAY